MERYQEIEGSIITKYRKMIWSRFLKGCKEFELVNEGDNIAVCISGGKDSMLLAKCMQELQRHSPIKFGLKFMVMDPGYNKRNRELIESNAKLLNIPIEIFESDIFDAVVEIGKNPCYMCARMRRGFLYRHAQMLGCNKIALGHHFDDVIETLLMSILYGAQVQGMPPKLKSKNFEGMELIRPMYYVKEVDILAWKRYNQLEFLRCACRFTEKCEEHEDASKRLLIKKLIAELKKGENNVDINIFRSMYNVHVDTLISYDTKGEEYPFLQRYDD